MCIEGTNQENQRGAQKGSVSALIVIAGMILFGFLVHRTLVFIELWLSKRREK
jgi:hypothetical protein